MPTQLLLIRSHVVSHQYANPVPQSVVWGEHVLQPPAQIISHSHYHPLAFPWHMGIAGLFELVSRICPVNVSQPNVDFLTKGGKDVRPGNTFRDKNKNNPWKVTAINCLVNMHPVYFAIIKNPLSGTSPFEGQGSIQVLWGSPQQSQRLALPRHIINIYCLPGLIKKLNACKM